MTNVIAWPELAALPATAANDDGGAANVVRCRRATTVVRPHLTGAEVLEMFQFGVVQGNVPISVAALSYAGQLTLSVVADGALTDLDVFVGGMAEALDGVLEHRRTGPSSLPLQGGSGEIRQWREGSG